MKVLKMEAYNYRLVEEDDAVYLYVLCGSSAAMFERKIKIKHDEVNNILSDENTLKTLINHTRDN